MKLNWPHIFIPLGIGVIAGLVTNASMWIGLATALTSVVTIVAAGVLVRLARGIPFSAIDVLDTEEANRLAKALKESVRALKCLLLACFITIFLLVFINHLVDLKTWLSDKILPAFCNSFDFISAFISAPLAYVFVRANSVVDGDIQISDIQADLLLKKRGKEKADQFEKEIAEPAKRKFKSPKGYGNA